MRKNLYDFLFSQKAIVTVEMYKDYSQDIQRLITESMARNLAQDVIKNGKLDTTIHDFHIEFELEVIVATKNEFMQMVHERAEELSRFNNGGYFNPNLIEFIREDKR
jgi:hypothetical protein